MSDKLGAPILADDEYDDSKRSKNTIDDIRVDMSAFLADGDTDYSTKKSSLDDIVLDSSALSDDFSPIKTQRNTSLDDVQVASASALTDEAVNILPTEKKSLDDVAAGMGSSSALQAEEVLPKYESEFGKQAREEAKKAAKQKAIDSALSSGSDKIDKERSRQMYLELMREKDKDLAKKGFSLLLLYMFIGLIGSVAFFLFLGESITKYRTGTGDYFFMKAIPFSQYACYASAFCSLLLILPAKGLKGLNSFVFFVLGVAAVILGIMLLTAKENIPVSICLLAGAVIAFAVVFFSIGGSEAIDKYYAHEN